MQPRTCKKSARGPLRALPALALALLTACAVHRDRQDQTYNLPQPPAPPSDGAIFHSGYNSALFENPTARNVGDVVTVVLEESTSAQKTSQTATSKTTKDTLAAPTIFGMPVHALAGSTNNANAFAGAGSTQQSDSLAGEISVTVGKRLPNGDLVIAGQTELDLSQGSEFIRLEGVIRPIDIASDNTIPSYDVADARIAYGQHGALNDANAPGLLSRFFNIPWLPF